MTPRRLALLSGICALATACSSAPPRPTGAGSTEILRLLRDWRGVWTTQVKDSPMGPLQYTLYVEPKVDHLAVTSAPSHEAGLDSIHHEYRFFHFDQGVPSIEFVLEQKGRVDKGTLVYKEDPSSDDEAVFCSEDHGCDKLKMTFEVVNEKAISVKTMADEAPHVEFTLAFASQKIPKDHGAWLDKPDAPKDTAKKPKVKLDEDGNPIDQDLVLKEHTDEDVGVKKNKPKAKPASDGDDAPKAKPKKKPAKPEKSEDDLE